MTTLKRASFALLAVVLAVIAFFALRAILTEDEPAPPPVPATAMVDGPDVDRKADDVLRLAPVAQDVRGDAVDGEYPDLDGNMRGPDPAPAGVPSGPLAAQEWPGCKTAFVGSFSSRRGVRPTAIAYHYTAGSNRPGWSDLDGLTAYSDNPRNQVSWHFGVDREGNCAYNVPVNQKAWTIAALNPQTINFEIVGTGKEDDYAGTAGLRKVAQITHRISRLYGIPVRLGATDGNCHVTRSGIITHWMGSRCSGGHHDVRPYVIEAIIAKVRALGAPVPGQLPGPSPKPDWFWVALSEWLGGQRDGLDGPSPKPPWFWGAVTKWQAQH